MAIHTIKQSYMWRAMIVCMPVSNETSQRRPEMVKLRDVARQKIFHGKVSRESHAKFRQWKRIYTMENN